MLLLGRWDLSEEPCLASVPVWEGQALWEEKRACLDLGFTETVEKVRKPSTQPDNLPAPVMPPLKNIHRQWDPKHDPPPAGPGSPEAKGPAMEEGFSLVSLVTSDPHNILSLASWATESKIFTICSL